MQIPRADAVDVERLTQERCCRTTVSIGSIRRRSEKSAVDSLFEMTINLSNLPTIANAVAHPTAKFMYSTYIAPDEMIMSALLRRNRARQIVKGLTDSRTSAVTCLGTPPSSSSEWWIISS